MASDEEWGQRMAIAIFRSPVAQERVLDIEQAAARVGRIRDRLDASEHEIDGLKRDLLEARAEVERLRADLKCCTCADGRVRPPCEVCRLYKRLADKLRTEEPTE